MKSQTFELSTIPYGQEAILILASSCAEAADIINGYNNIHKLEDRENSSRGFVWQTYFKTPKDYQKTRLFIYINYDEIYPEVTPEHEVIHLAWAILECVGVKVTYSNHETLTYFHDYLLTQIRACVEIALKDKTEISL